MESNDHDVFCGHLTTPLKHWQNGQQWATDHEEHPPLLQVIAGVGAGIISKVQFLLGLMGSFESMALIQSECTWS